MVFCRTEQIVEECGCLPVDAPDAHQWNLTVCNYKNATGKHFNKPLLKTYFHLISLVSFEFRFTTVLLVNI